jgi:hypothetical protein
MIPSQWLDKTSLRAFFLQLTAFFRSALILASSAAVSSFSVKATVQWIDIERTALASERQHLAEELLYVIYSVCAE